MMVAFLAFVVLFGGADQDDDFLDFPAIGPEDRWSVSIAFRHLLIVAGPDAADDPVVAGFTGSLRYDELWEDGFGGRVEAYYRAGEWDDPVAWGGFFAFSGDVFQRTRATTAGLVFIPDDLTLIQGQVGVKLAAPPPRDGGAFTWEIRGGVGVGYIHQVDATVIPPGGPRLAHQGFFTDSFAFTAEIAVRLGYARDNWSIFGGMGWNIVADPTEGQLGTNPEALQLFPLEIGISIAF